MAELTAPDLFERAIIGSLLSVESEDARSLAGEIDEQLFESPQGKHAYRLLRKAALSGNPLGFDTAQAALESSPGHSEAYGAHANAVEAYLSSCVECCDPVDSWPEFGKQLALVYAKRKVSQSIDKATVEAFLAGSPGEVADAALAPIVSAASDVSKISGRGGQSIREIADDYLELYRKGDEPIPFCQERLNSVGGFRPGNLVFFAAYTGGLKSWWAIDLALETAQAGKRVRYYTLEMPRHEVLERIIGMLDEQRSLTVEDLILRKVDRRVIENYTQMIEKLPLSIIDGGCSPQRIMSDAIALGDKKPHVIIVDHMHLLRYASDDKRIGIDDALAEFKSFAVEHGIAIVLLCQLSRPENRTKPPKPSMYMAKESGGIEQIADFFILTHKSVEMDMGFKREERTMWVEKQRQGVPPEEFVVDFRRYRIR